MRYEARIGWRYLYGGHRDKAMTRLALGAAVVSVVALVSMIAGANAVGVVALVVGMVSTAVFGLMAAFSVFTSVSVMGVALGVAALTIVLAVTTGFQREFRDKVLGVNAHVIVTKPAEDGFPEYHDVMTTALAIDPDVLAVQPFIFAEMLATRGKGDLSGVAIKGIDPKRVKNVLDLDKHMIEGSIDALETTGTIPPIIIGKELAHKLKAKLGDIVTIVSPLANLDLETGRAKGAPHTRPFRVAGIFYSGFDEYDRRLIYAAIGDVQRLLGIGDEARGVEMKIKDVDRADEIAKKLEKKLGSPFYEVQDWYQLNHNLFTALNLQKLALVIILTLIIIVAAVNMVSALTMMVTDKTREIAILKSMGATNGGISQVFQVVGIAIGGVGTLIGVVIGLATCFVVGGYGYHLDPKVYLIDKLPIEVRGTEVLIVAGITMAVSIIATVFPARSAAGMRPVDGLRYD